MADKELLDFTIEGASERNGNVTAETFIAKLRQFVSTIYAFERAFTKRDKRNIDLEVVELSRKNPTNVKFKHRAREAGYYSSPAMKWTFDQIDRVQKGLPVDDSLPQSAIDNVIELARHRGKDERDFSALRIGYDSKVLSIDARLEAQAMALRVARQVDTKPIWHNGVSKGSVFGELRGVMDFEGERRFYILPPSGPSEIECIFPEHMRQQMNDNLFKVVRIDGFLRYDGQTPFPYLFDAEKFVSIHETPEAHLSDMRGLFRDLAMPEEEDFF